jgi:hypothetical protein
VGSGTTGASESRTPPSKRPPSGQVAELDRYTEKLRQETPLLAITRTDTIRYLIARALEEFAGPPEGKSGVGSIEPDRSAE